MVAERCCLSSVGVTYPSVSSCVLPLLAPALFAVAMVEQDMVCGMLPPGSCCVGAAGETGWQQHVPLQLHRAACACGELGDG